MMIPLTSAKQRNMLFFMFIMSVFHSNTRKSTVGSFS